MPLIPTFERQRQEDFCDYEASLVYIERVPGLHNEILSQNKQKNNSNWGLGDGEMVQGSRAHTALPEEQSEVTYSCSHTQLKIIKIHFYVSKTWRIRVFPQVLSQYI